MAITNTYVVFNICQAVFQALKLFYVRSVWVLARGVFATRLVVFLFLCSEELGC